MRTTEESVVASASGVEDWEDEATLVSRGGGGAVFFTGALFAGGGGRVFSVSTTAATCAVSSGVVVAIVSVDGEGAGRERFAFIRMTSATATIPSAPTLARNERAAGDIEMNIRFSGSFRKKEIQCMLSSNAGLV